MSKKARGRYNLTAARLIMEHNANGEGTGLFTVQVGNPSSLPVQRELSSQSTVRGNLKI